ncbi:MAG: hypothetical protein J5507_00125 [Clostridia bacterium]|nr:hypothetical protein [Clostridia bacterium]
MTILVGVGINFGTDAIKKAKLEDIKTDMISIKTRAKIIAEESNFNGSEISALPGVQATDEELNIIGLQNLSNDDKQKVRKWNDEALQSQGLSTIEGDKYVVKYDLDNPNDCEVYYLEGYDGSYSLSALQEK